MDNKFGRRIGQWVGLFSILSVSVSWASGANASVKKNEVSLNEIKAAISAKHSQWIAGETSVSKLPLAEVQQMLGSREPPGAPLVDDSDDWRAFDEESTIDWRDRQGARWVGPVLNQGNCGSCVAFATVGTLEAQAAINAGKPNLRASFSPQALFACGGGACNRGWMPSIASLFMKYVGTVDEACLPYTSGSTGEDAKCSQKCSDSKDRTLKVQGTRSGGHSIASVKAALIKGPLITTLTVYADFDTYVSGVYKHVSGAMLGGHAVSLVGYDNDKRAWLIRNSWGEEWGEKGFAWISWDDTSGVGNSTWGFDFGADQFKLSVTSPKDREYVSDAAHFAADGAGTSAQLQIKGTPGFSTTLGCSTQSQAGCVTTLDTTTLADGRYEIMATSPDGSKSQTREFFVLNHPPQMALAFAPARGVDITKPLKDRPEFDVTATFGNGVPIQHLEFRAYDSNGQLAAIKSNDQVLAHMKMGWRTTTVPNGSYRLVVHGETTYHGQVYAVDSASMNITVKN